MENYKVRCLQPTLPTRIPKSKVGRQPSLEVGSLAGSLGGRHVAVHVPLTTLNFR